MTSCRSYLHWGIFERNFPSTRSEGFSFSDGKDPGGGLPWSSAAFVSPALPGGDGRAPQLVKQLSPSWARVNKPNLCQQPLGMSPLRLSTGPSLLCPSPVVRYCHLVGTQALLPVFFQRYPTWDTGKWAILKNPAAASQRIAKSPNVSHDSNPRAH